MNTEDKYIHTKRALTVLFGTGLGSFLEFYSFGLIAYFQEVISKAFFPATSDPTIALFQSFTLYGSAYITRPIGGLLFGYIADKHGRVISLRWSILLMCFPTVLIGCIPSFATIGYFSTILVFICRILQGLAAGGEISTSLIYVSEEAPLGRQGLYIALIWMFSAGEFLSLVAYEILRHVTSETFFNSIGFRIPFWLAIFIAIAAVYARYLLPFTHQFETMNNNNMILHNPITYAFKNNCREIFSVSFAMIIPPLMYSISLAWTAAYLEEIKGDNAAYDVALIGYIFWGVFTLLFGYLSDKYTAYIITIYTTSIGFVVSFLVFLFLGMTDDIIALTILQLVEIAVISSFSVPMLIWSITYLSDPRTRTTVLGFSYNIGTAIILSSALDVCTGLQSLHDTLGGMFVGIYVSIAILLAWLGVCYGHRHPYRYDGEYCTIEQSDDIHLITDEDITESVNL
eukprot:102409_1